MASRGRSKCGGVEKALDFKDQGNQQYSQQKYSEAIRLYTDAIKADQFNHLCYGNRAQAYQKLENYQEALADGRRAVLMKPDWIKGYYRYSQAFYHTGKIDMAIAINKKGMRICEKTKNNDKMLSELKDQGQKLQFQKDGVASDEVLHQMIKNNRMDDSVPEQIRNFPGCTVINIESAMSQWSQKRFSQDPSVLLSSDDHDSSEEESVLVPYSEAKKKIVELRKQAKDPEVEKLHLNKTQGKIVVFIGYWCIAPRCQRPVRKLNPIRWLCTTMDVASRETESQEYQREPGAGNKKKMKTERVLSKEEMIAEINANHKSDAVYETLRKSYFPVVRENTRLLFKQHVKCSKCLAAVDLPKKQITRRPIPATYSNSRWSQRHCHSTEHTKFVTWADEEPVLGYAIKPSIDLAFPATSYFQTSNTCIYKLNFFIPENGNDMPTTEILFGLIDYSFSNNYFGWQ
ncbi:unnamed protein product [Mytilus edulis]|uniref:Uncharacterized protein n=1 Tax=Mytilus edulis TaxID=6550 RepID=A0A8S3QTH3_MYTED|nr:unnamed protein product [Mytilus edulis]